MDKRKVVCYLPEGSNEDGFNGPGWYFRSITWDHVYGPYGSEEEANIRLIEYVRDLIGG